MGQAPIDAALRCAAAETDSSADINCRESDMQARTFLEQR